MRGRKATVFQADALPGGHAVGIASATDFMLAAADCECSLNRLVEQHNVKVSVAGFGNSGMVRGMNSPAVRTVPVSEAGR